QVVKANLDWCLQTKHAAVISHDRFSVGGVHALCWAVLISWCVATVATDFILALIHGEEVQTSNHVQTWHSKWLTGSRRENVVRGQHQHACFSLCFSGQRQVDCHLVTVEVGVERFTSQWVQLNSLTFDQLWFESLNTQAVQGWCAVQKNWVLRNSFFQNVPNLWTLALNHALCGLNVLRIVVFHQTLHDEWLEQLQSHQLRQTTLMQLELRTNNNDRTARVVNALTQQVLTETTLLTLEQVAQGLQRTAAWTRYWATTTTVVEERVDRFLQHALLVVHDDLRRAKIDHALQTVVAVDYATVQVIQVGGSKATTVELNHWAQFWWDHWDRIQDHASWVIARTLECSNDLQALERAHLLLALAIVDDLAQLFCLCIEVEVANQGLDSLSTHAAGEVIFVAVNELLVDGLINDHLLWSKLVERIPDLVQTCDFTLTTFANVLHFLISSILYLAASISLSAFCFQSSQVIFQLRSTLCNFCIHVIFDVLLLQEHFALKSRQVVVASLIIHGGDDVGSEVDDALKILWSKIQQVAQTGWNTLEVPDVGHWSSKLNVAHAFTTNLGLGDLYATALTNDALVADTLVLTTLALPVTGRTEDTLTEKAVLFWLQGAVVNGLRLLNLALRPTANVVGGGQSNTKLVEEIYV